MVGKGGVEPPFAVCPFIAVGVLDGVPAEIRTRSEGFVVPQSVQLAYRNIKSHQRFSDTFSEVSRASTAVRHCAIGLLDSTCIYLLGASQPFMHEVWFCPARSRRVESVRTEMGRRAGFGPAVSSVTTRRLDQARLTATCRGPVGGIRTRNRRLQGTLLYIAILDIIGSGGGT